MDILVTGGRGYLGGWVVETLRSRGHTVGVTGSRDPADWFRGFQNIRFMPDAIVHLAWYSSAGNQWPYLQEKCLDETRKLVAWLSSWKSLAPRFIFPSTLSVYGANGMRVNRESDWTSPQCAYTRAKATAEWYIRSLMPDATILRFASLMGKGFIGHRTRTDLVVNAFSSEGYHKGEIEVWAPEAYKPVIHIRDAAHIIALAVEGTQEWSGTFNVANGERLTSEGIANMVCDQIERKFGKRPKLKLVGDANGASNRSIKVSCERMLELVGLERPVRKVEETILEFEGFVPSESDKNKPWTS